MKSKFVAGILALFFGIFGVHRFYVGSRIQGIMHLLLFFITLGITIDGGFPAVIAPALIGFIDAILFLTMPAEDFDEKYNARRLKAGMGRKRYDAAEDDWAEDDLQPASKKSNPTLPFLKTLGIERFRSGDFEGAVDAFVKALEKGVEYPWLHFNLACCYSMIEDAGSSMEHLEKAVANGFTDLDKIHKHAALQHVREHPEFAGFVARGFKKAPETDQRPQTESEGLALQPLNPLDQILQLGELKEKGLLSEEEFQREKQKLLR